MKPPIFICEHGDVTSFSNQDNAELHLEAIDVKNKEYIAYDSEGHLLDLKVVIKKTNGFFGVNFVEGVKLSDLEKSESHKDILKEILSQFLIKSDSPVEWIAQASFEDIIKAAAVKAAIK